ncbi:MULTISPECIES: hypothetical protein [unclassified Streptomyces]|uniref:hypothetical protein n=1 Tax=unclassified Streptomyces TaxID=2593676 RepID=UPI00278C4DFC|nr:MULTISPECIES: hypothetical protein [unclassified Streptomyces]
MPDVTTSAPASGATPGTAPISTTDAAPDAEPPPVPAPAEPPAPVTTSPAEQPAPAPAPHPEPAPVAPTAPPMPAHAPARPTEPPTSAAASQATPPPPGGADPHGMILVAVREGRHGEAASIAAMWESEALRVYGLRSAEVIHWMEVRADLARLADEPGRSCELWIGVAHARMARGEAPSDEDVEAAVDRAHHQWEQVGDPGRARGHAAALTALREQVPGRRPGALDAIKRRLDALSAT